MLHTVFTLSSLFASHPITVFLKYWGDGCMGRPPTSIFLGGRPQSLLSLRPCLSNRETLFIRPVLNGSTWQDNIIFLHLFIISFLHVRVLIILLTALHVSEFHEGLVSSIYIYKLLVGPTFHQHNFV